MIGPSRRRQRSAGPSGDLSLHLRLARRRDRQRHLHLAGVVALLVAVVTWLLGLDLAGRTLAVSTAVVLSWLVPLRGSERWALDWIAERAGLAYQTALETGGGHDGYGFQRALEARARESAGHVAAPSHSAWWLPLLALALGALLLPALPLAIPGGGAGPGGPTAGGGVQEPLPAQGQESEPEDALDTPDEERARVDPPAEGSDRGARGDERGQPGEGAVGEQAALERFLRNIRERPESTREETEEGEEGAADRPGSRSDEAGGERRQGEEDGAGEEQRRAGEENGEGDGEAAGVGEEGEEEGQESPNPFAEAGGDQEPEGDQEAGQAAGVEGAGEESPDGQEGDEAGGRRADEGEDDTGLGEGAGGQPSPEQQAEAGERAMGEPLFLEGELGPGQVAPGGAVQLPGVDDVELPEGASPESYRREVERSVSEGRIPLEYQEIIRNYFR